MLGREPALWIAAFRSLLYLFVLFGLNLSNEQIGGLILFTEAILTLVTRQSVVPNTTLRAAGYEPKAFAGLAAGATTRKTGPRRLAWAAILVAVSLASACANGPTPNTAPQTPVGKVAATADQVITQTAIALDGVEAFEAQGLIPTPLAKTIAKQGEYIGQAGAKLADALDAYRVLQSTQNYTNVQDALRSIRNTVDEILKQIPDSATKTRVQAIVQPILKAALDVSLAVAPPNP